MNDFIVVGGGIGGTAAALWLSKQGYRTLLLEKAPYLGGCSSTFTHKGAYYNTGATTFTGYQKGHILYEFFNDLGVSLPIQPIDPALTVMIGNKQIKRYQNIETFISQIEYAWPHHKHAEFWHLLSNIAKTFYAHHDYYYSHATLFKRLRSLISFSPLIKALFPYLLQSAETFIHRFYGSVDAEYRDFINAQLLIVAQAPLEKVNVLTAALALTYTFANNYHVPGGMGALFKAIQNHIDNLHTQSEVTHIERTAEGYSVHTHKEKYRAKNIVLNTPLYTASEFFTDRAIQRYYKKFVQHDNFQSAFILYMRLKSNRSYAHHYQLIEASSIKHTLSNALFVSVLKQEHEDASNPECITITASIHTDYRWWSKEDTSRYQQKKKELQEVLMEIVCDKLDINKNDLIDLFSATPATFKRYINRWQLGGNPMTMANMLLNTPANDTPFKGLYHVGDSTFAAQGWPGVIAGVINLTKVIDE